MNIGTISKPLLYVDESPWVEVLNAEVFWGDNTAYDGVYDSIHKKLAFFLLMTDGVLGQSDTYGAGSPAFDHVRAPQMFLNSQRTQQLVYSWAKIHEDFYGPGSVTKMGLYCFAPGGVVGYHVDGAVRIEGTAVDLSKQSEWASAIHTQASHRTVMPIRLDPKAEFLVVGNSVRMTPGLLFEFSNTLPHAFFNGPHHHTVFLVTTYKPHRYNGIQHGVCTV